MEIEISQSLAQLTIGLFPIESSNNGKRFRRAQVPRVVGKQLHNVVAVHRRRGSRGFCTLLVESLFVTSVRGHRGR